MLHDDFVSVKFFISGLPTKAKEDQIIEKLKAQQLSLFKRAENTCFDSEYFALIPKNILDDADLLDELGYNKNSFKII